MNTENKDMVNISDKEYNVNDMTTEQQYIVSQLKDLNAKKKNIQFQLDQLNAAVTTFTDVLMVSIKEVEKLKESEFVNSE